MYMLGSKDASHKICICLGSKNTLNMYGSKMPQQYAYVWVAECLMKKKTK